MSRVEIGLDLYCTQKLEVSLACLEQKFGKRMQFIDLDCAVPSAASY